MATDNLQKLGTSVEGERRHFPEENSFGFHRHENFNVYAG
jgi:hypothetical protein